MTRLGPDQPWPVHQRKEAREALADAKSQGWSLEEFSSHVFGKIACAVHTGPACEVTIFKTGRGDTSGAVTAKIISDKLRSCQNRQRKTGEELPVDPHAGLLRADRLAVAAERYGRSERLRSHSEERLARAEEAADPDAADLLLTEAEVAEERASAEDRAAWVDAHRFGLGEPWPPDEGTAALTKAAREQLELARSGLSTVDDPEDFAAHLASIEQRLSRDC